MSRDRREDTGAYYPGGTVIPVAPQQRTTQVPVTDVGDLGDSYTLADVKAKVNQVVQVLAQRTSALALLVWFCASASLSTLADLAVQTARLDALYNDATVVTNVSGAATEPSVVTNIVSGYVADATNATLAAANDYTDASIQSSGFVTPTIVTNIVKAVVTNDVAGSAVIGTRFATPVVYSYTSESVDYAITNLAVRWNGVYWEMHVGGWADNQTYHDGWYKCATTNWNNGNPYCEVNSNLNTDAVTVWIGDKTATGFSKNIADGLRAYANGTATYAVSNGTHNALGLAYERDVPTIVSNTVPSWAMSSTPPDFTTNNTALVSTITNVAGKAGGGTAQGIDLHDAGLGCDWQLSVSNSVFTWTVKED